MAPIIEPKAGLAGRPSFEAAARTGSGTLVRVQLSRADYPPLGRWSPARDGLYHAVWLLVPNDSVRCRRAIGRTSERSLVSGVRRPGRGNGLAVPKIVGDWECGIDRWGSDLVIAEDDRRTVLARFGLKRVDVASKKSTQSASPGSTGVQQVVASCVGSRLTIRSVTGVDRTGGGGPEDATLFGGRGGRNWDLAIGDLCGFFADGPFLPSGWREAAT
jgi:hypothetical protein